MILETILKLIFCHLVGDYVLQSEFLAKTKGENWYHLFIHCVLYCLPFYICFGLCEPLALIFLWHIFVDALKARYKRIGYVQDQILHYIALVAFLA
jgi:hypothetical protein